LRSETELHKEFGENGFWKEDYMLMLLTDRSGGLIGYLDAFKTSLNIQGIEAGYRIFEKKNMGKGYMTEALNLFSAYLFTANPTLPRLTLLIRSDNKGSRRVAEKCNYQPEGTLRNAWVDDGKSYPMKYIPC
jgi:ribosomal-protein-alanine N-acetyltransferase